MELKTKRVMGLVGATVIFAIAIGSYYWIRHRNATTSSFSPSAVDQGSVMGANEIEKSLEVDQEGLSRGVAVIQTTRGKIRFKFYAKDAPKTAHRIVELIQKGFYNGLSFHRVVPGFVVQGGDPTGTGMSGSGVTLPAEFNARKHVPGTVAMARAANPDSADSQFYISLGTHPHLDNQYTVFGQLIEGQEVANQIQVGDRMTSVSYVAAE